LLNQLDLVLIFGDLARIIFPGLKGWTIAKFRHMCILAGCDYLPKAGKGHIVGIGLIKACQLVRQYEDPNKAIRALRATKKLKVPEGFEKLFHKAE